MSIAFQNPFFTPSSPRLNPHLKNPPIISRHLSSRLSNSQILHFNPPKFPSYKTTHASSHPFLKAHESDSSIQNPNLDYFNLGSFLSIAELFCIFSSVVVSLFYAVSGWKGVILGVSWRRVMSWGGIGLACAVAAGCWIRRRQWRRICTQSMENHGRGTKMNLVERVEKLEEDLRSSVTVIRVLSRQLEKLGNRFRVTRKALKDPISQAAALAEKNSQATRALAVQEDILEKELGEIQNVLLAMQEQQQKQLELILAIAKSGNLFENKPLKPSPVEDTPKSVAKQMEVPQGSGNDRP